MQGQQRAEQDEESHRSPHLQLDPAVRQVVFAFDDPVCSRIRLAYDYVLYRIADQVVLGGNERVRLAQDFLESIGPLDPLNECGASVLASGQVGVRCLECDQEILETIRIKLDGAPRVIVFQRDNPKVLIGVRSFVTVELGLGKQQDTTRPVEVVLIKVVEIGRASCRERVSYSV